MVDFPAMFDDSGGYSLFHPFHLRNFGPSRATAVVHTQKITDIGFMGPFQTTKKKTWFWLTFYKSPFVTCFGELQSLQGSTVPRPRSLRLPRLGPQVGPEPGDVSSVQSFVLLKLLCLEGKSSVWGLVLPRFPWTFCPSTNPPWIFGPMLWRGQTGGNQLC